MHCHSVLVFVQWAMLKYLVIISGTLSKLFDWDTSKSKVAGILLLEFQNCLISSQCMTFQGNRWQCPSLTSVLAKFSSGEILALFGTTVTFLMLKNGGIQHSAIDSLSWLMLENCCISSDTLDSLWLQLMRVPAPYKLALIYGLPPWAMQKCDTLPRWVHIWISNSDFGNISACPGCLWQLAIFC